MDPVTAVIGLTYLAAHGLLKLVGGHLVDRFAEDTANTVYDGIKPWALKLLRVIRGLPAEHQPSIGKLLDRLLKDSNDQAAKAQLYSLLRTLAEDPSVEAKFADLRDTAPKNIINQSNIDGPVIIQHYKHNNIFNVGDGGTVNVAAESLGDNWLVVHATERPAMLPGKECKVTLEVSNSGDRERDVQIEPASRFRDVVVRLSATQLTLRAGATRAITVTIKPSSSFPQAGQDTEIDLVFIDAGRHIRRSFPAHIVARAAATVSVRDTVSTSRLTGKAAIAVWVANTGNTDILPSVALTSEASTSLEIVDHKREFGDFIRRRNNGHSPHTRPINMTVRATTWPFIGDDTTVPVRVAVAVDGQRLAQTDVPVAIKPVINVGAMVAAVVLVLALVGLMVWLKPDEPPPPPAPKAHPAQLECVANLLDPSLRTQACPDLTGWSRPTSGKVFSSPVFDGDRRAIYVGSDGGVFYAVHADTGEDMFSPVLMASAAAGTPLVSRDTAYVAEEGTVHALNTTDGTEQSTFSLGNGAWRSLGAPVVLDGVVYLGRI